MDKYVQSEIEESRIARLILDGHSPTNPVKLWHAPGIPTVYNAIYIIAPQKGIIPIADKIQPTATPNNQKVFVATVKAQCNGNTRYGAATSKDADVARLLAYRNSIRQLLSND